MPYKDAEKHRENSRRRYHAMTTEQKEAEVARTRRYYQDHPDKKRDAQKKYHRTHRETIAQYNILYNKTHREIRRAQVRRSRRRHPEQHRAHEAVARAVRDGSMCVRPCEICGDKSAEAHHDDYSKPLNVRWLCRQHHVEHHRKCKEQKDL